MQVCPWDWSSTSLRRSSPSAGCLIIVHGLAESDQLVADAIFALMGRLSATPNPPRGVVREALRWLGQKVDVFVEEAAKTGGKAAGAFVSGAAGYLVLRYVPQLRDAIHDVLRLVE